VTRAACFLSAPVQGRPAWTGEGQWLTLTPKRVAAMAQRGCAASFQSAVGSGGPGQARPEMPKMTKAITASVSRSSDLASYRSMRSDTAIARDLAA